MSKLDRTLYPGPFDRYGNVNPYKIAWITELGKIIMRIKRMRDDYKRMKDIERKRQEDIKYKPEIIKEPIKEKYIIIDIKDIINKYNYLMGTMYYIYNTIARYYNDGFSDIVGWKLNVNLKYKPIYLKETRVQYNDTVEQFIESLIDNADDMFNEIKFMLEPLDL